MAFIDTVSNDIFISYRYVDNTPDMSGQPWVIQFIRHLEMAVVQRLGGANDLKIYFDQRDAQSNYGFPELMGEVRSSAIFVAIASRAYVKESWALKELETFLAAGRPANSLFVIEVLPLDRGDEYPDCLRQKLRLQFWHSCGPESRTPMTLSLPEDASLYYRRIHDLAEQIRARLLEFKRSCVPESDRHRNASVARSQTRSTTSVPTPAPGSVKGAVYLAQTTDDLVEQREQVRSYLEQSGLQVLPTSEYPQGGDAFKEAVVHDLEHAELFVQLLGGFPGRKPPDLPEGYTHYQVDAAKAAGKPILQWRHPALNPETVLDEPYRNLLTSETTIASGLESFKTEIVRRFEKPPLSPREKTPSLVYIDADRVDFPIAQSIKDALKSRQVAVALPIFEGSADEIRLDLEENMIDSDTLIFIYGKAPPGWVRQHLRRFNRTLPKRTVPPTVVVLYQAPPSEKAEIGLDLPYLKLLKCGQSIDIAPLLELLER